MACRIIWSPKAANQLADICENIALDSQQYAKIFAQKLLRLVRLLADFPQSGRIVPEFDDPCLREIIYGNYRVVYRLPAEPPQVEIVAICHGSRLIRNVLPESVK